MQDEKNKLVGLAGTLRGKIIKALDELPVWKMQRNASDNRDMCPASLFKDVEKTVPELEKAKANVIKFKMEIEKLALEDAPNIKQGRIKPTCP